MPFVTCSSFGFDLECLVVSTAVMSAVYQTTVQVGFELKSVDWVGEYVDVVGLQEQRAAVVPGPSFGYVDWKQPGRVQLTRP